jgi:hypothetical protein
MANSSEGTLKSTPDETGTGVGLGKVRQSSNVLSH